MSDLHLGAYHWLIFDEEANPHRQDVLSALAYEDSFIRFLPQINAERRQPRAIFHLYPYHQPTILLGGKDTRLTDAQAGYHFLTQQGYQLALRPHGGLAIVNDPGVVNFALITDHPQNTPEINHAYEFILYFVQRLFKPYGVAITHQEVSRSYCPGQYDLVVDGLKVGGTAQRRFKTGVATAAYLSLNGSQEQRALLLRQFYQISQADPSYPDIDPQVMTTLTDCLGNKAEPYTLAHFKTDCLQLLRSHSTLSTGHYDDPQLDVLYQPQLDRLTLRNQTIR